jgi:hypothetical protein
MARKPDDIEKKLNRKLADLRKSAKRGGGTKLPTRLLLDRELIEIYKLLKEIHTKPLKEGDILSLVFGSLIVFLFWVMLIISVVFFIYTEIIKPGSMWLSTSWGATSPGTQLTLIVTIAIAAMGGTYKLMTHFKKK